MGPLGGAGFNLLLQLGSNWVVSDDIGKALRCIDYVDVAISGAIGAVGPTFWTNLVKGKVGPGEATCFTDTYLCLATSLPDGYAAKKITPSWRPFENPCDNCQSLRADVVQDQLSHLLL